MQAKITIPESSDEIPEDLEANFQKKTALLTQENEEIQTETKQLREELKVVKERTLQGAEMQGSLPTRTDAQVALSTSTTGAEVKGSEGFARVFHSRSFSDFSGSSQNQVKLSYADRVESASKSVQDKIKAEDLKALLKWVTEGHLEEVEKLLKKNPNLGLGTSTVTDRSERTFKNITALQYAAWALDAEMAELIVKYIGAHDSAMQLNGLEMAPERYSEYGASYDFKGLVNKYQVYIDNYSKWDYGKCCQYWQKEIGGEQQKCPAWLVYAWSEEGDDVAWTKQDGTRKVKREYDRHRLDWWFTENYNNGRGVGSSWAAFRTNSHAAVKRGASIGDTFASFYLTYELLVLTFNRDCISLLGTARYETLQWLKKEVEHSLMDNPPRRAENKKIT